MDINIIATGSKGNAVVINRSILIDCGVPFNKLAEVKKNLKLVLMTHAHGDHFRPATVRALAKERPALRWACCEWMVEPLVKAGVDKRVIDVLLSNESPSYCAYFYSGLHTRVFPTLLTHDVPNCGWALDISGERLFYATDTANLDGITASNYDYYLIEANYTEADIERRIAEKMAAGEFCYEARAKKTHMSQETALEWLSKNMGKNSQYMFLHRHKDA